MITCDKDETLYDKPEGHLMLFAHMPIIRDIVYGAVAHGASLHELCRSCGITSKDLNDSDRQMEFSQAYRVWEHAVKQTGDKLLGLHLGATANPTILGLVGHLMQSSSSLKESFQNVCRYSELATNMFYYRISEQSTFVLLEFQPAELWLKISPETARQAVEQAMSGTLHIFQHLAGKKVALRKAELAYRRPAPLVEYERIFDAPVGFGEKSNRLVFDSNDLNQPVLSYDQSLVALFDGLLKNRISKLKRSTQLREQIKEMMLTDFKGQLPSIEIIASCLNLTPRTLQRRLNDEGTTFRALTETMRKDLAIQLMKERRVTAGEVAGILGYSDASAFRRALRKWKQ